MYLNMINKTDYKNMIVKIIGNLIALGVPYEDIPKKIEEASCSRLTDLEDTLHSDEEFFILENVFDYIGLDSQRLCNILIGITKDTELAQQMKEELDEYGYIDNYENYTHLEDRRLSTYLYDNFIKGTY